MYVQAHSKLPFSHHKICHFLFYSTLAPFDPKAVDVTDVCFVQMRAQDFVEESSHLVKGLLLCDELGVMVGNLMASVEIKQGLCSALSMVAEHMMR